MTVVEAVDDEASSGVVMVAGLVAVGAEAAAVAMEADAEAVAMGWFSLSVDASSCKMSAIPTRTRLLPAASAVFSPAPSGVSALASDAVALEDGGASKGASSGRSAGEERREERAERASR